MFLGYNTNGMAHHELLDAVELLAALGYRGVAVTIDHTALPPYAPDARERIEALGQRLTRLEMRSVIETGARYLLDPREKHEPTLVSPDPEGRARRIAFYRYAIDTAAALGSDCVSIWSGRLHEGVTPIAAMDWLAEGLDQVLDYAAQREVAIGLEPEPGMLVDGMDAWQRLLQHERICRPPLGLTLDLGHLHCQCEPIAVTIDRWREWLVNVHIEDMCRGVHEHLMFGEGEIEFPAVLRALAASGYSKGVYVELSRHSHMAPEAARRAIEFLGPLMNTEN